MIHNDFISLFLLTEGYGEVKNRLIDNYGANKDKLDELFNFHQKYKFKFKNINIDNQSIDASNIDVYFSKANITKYTTDKLIDALSEKVAEIQASLPTQTKNESKIEDLKKLLVAETNDYVFFKVPTWEDAVKLKRPGKGNPWNLPPMIPVDWCITADSSMGENMFKRYTENSTVFGLPKVIDYSIDNNDRLVYVKPRANFYFFFRKNNSLKNDAFDYVAINSINNGDFSYTTSPNSEMNKGWPKEVPSELQSKIEFPEKIKEVGESVHEISPRTWATILAISPNLYPKCDKFRDFNDDDWVYLLGKQPQFIEWAEQYKILHRLSINDWTVLLSDNPVFTKLFNKYNGNWQEITPSLWLEILEKQPQLIHYCLKYNTLTKFSGRDLCLIMVECPGIVKNKQFQRFMIEEGFLKFNSADWIMLLGYKPEYSHMCDKFNGWSTFTPTQWAHLIDVNPQFASKLDNNFPHMWDDFSGENWAWLLKDQPQLISKCDEYNGWEKLDQNDWWAIYFSATGKYEDQIKQRAEQYQAGRKMLQDLQYERMLG